MITFFYDYSRLRQQIKLIGLFLGPHRRSGIDFMNLLVFSEVVLGEKSKKETVRFLLIEGWIAMRNLYNCDELVLNLFS